MNKNSLIAFILIMLVVMFFTSPQYNKFFNEVTGRKPVPAEKGKSLPKKEEPESQVQIDTTEKITPSEEKKDSVSKDTVIEESQKDVEDTIWVETENMIAGINEKGGNIISIKMKKYLYTEGNRKGEYVDLIPQNSEGGAQISVAGESLKDKIFKYNGESEKKVEIEKGNKKDLVFEHTLKNGDVIKKIFSFMGEGYQIGMKVSGTQLSGERIGVSWLSGIEESETSGSQPEQRIVHYSDGSSVQHINMRKTEKEEITGNYRWIGVTSKYFFISIVSDSVRDADLTIKGFETDAKGKNRKSIKSINYEISYTNSANENTESYWFYTGPNQLETLKSFNLKFEKILFPVTGWTRWFFYADKWFPWLAEFTLWLLLVLYNLVKDFGVAILLITILSRVVTYPMTQSSTKSMSRMKDIQPKVEAIRKRYKNNPRKMNEEIMAIYREEGINPLNPGCLPLFLQMPIFIALFVVLRKAIELRGAGTWVIPWVNDLSRPESLISLTSIFPQGIPLYGTSIALLPIIMAVLTYFQNKMTIKDPNQKAMIYFMPVFMLVLFNNFPAGLVLYWTASSALGLLQQYYIEKKNKKSVAEATAKKK